MTDSSNDPFTALLGNILGNPARLRVTQLLVRLPDKEFTGRETARLLGLSPSTALEALRILAASGLAHRRTIGRAYVFQANRDSYLFSILDNLLRSEDRIRKELLKKVRSTLGDGAVSVVLFGSYARGTPGPSSDLDLLVVTEDPKSMGGRLDKLEALFLRRYGLHVDAKVLTPQELRARASLPYVRAARAEGIAVGGRSLEEVIGHGSQDP
ncbi:MAG TPA: nucleotidyltransferase domain-containing protein [Thermoplasmata archaeon]|nr:nucleotidyltransferase domain-containing protein [Thermoplasmata archaeon]